MSKPTRGSLRRLRRVGCYVKNNKRLVWNFEMQDEQDTIDVDSDSDWAGCRRSRKSTSGCAIMCVSHCLKTWSKTQAAVAKSSSEAELYAVVRGATEALGMATLAKDLGKKVEIRMHLDALAAKGMIKRKGLSKVRPLDVNVLWLQEQCARKILPVHKVPGEENPADLMTKHLGAAHVRKHMKIMQMELTEGRATKAAQLHAVLKDGGFGVLCRTGSLTRRAAISGRRAARPECGIELTINLVGPFSHRTKLPKARIRELS